MGDIAVGSGVVVMMMMMIEEALAGARRASSPGIMGFRHRSESD